MLSILKLMVFAVMRWLYPKEDRSLELAKSNLQVYITEVSIQKRSLKPFDPQNGCPLTGAPYSKFYGVVKYAIYNSGVEDFVPSITSGYIGEADCHKPAIFKFLTLEGLIPGGAPLTKFATCVVDDELAGADACTATASGMKIRTGKSFGGTKVVSVKFAISDTDFATLLSTNPTTTLDLKLSVNPLISNGAAVEVSISRGSELSTHNWLDPTVFPDPVVLFGGPKIVIDNLQPSKVCGSLLFINLAEVQLFYNNVQIPSSSLKFTFSSTLTDTIGVEYSASKCNDGDLTDLCHTDTGDSNPTLTIVSSALFDTVKVYNRADGNNCVDRIEGATITSTINGQSSSTVFPQSADALYIFTILPSTGTLQLYHDPTHAPTVSPTAAPVPGINQVVITNLQLSKTLNDKYINLAEVQLFFNNVQLASNTMTFTFSSTIPVTDGVSYDVTKCNNGDLTDVCHTNTGDSNPTLTIVSQAVFDTVKVYNRGNCCQDRIEGATITTIVNGGQPSSTVFPQTADALYTFSLSSGSLVYST